MELKERLQELGMAALQMVLHTAELAVVFGVVYLTTKYFNIGSEMTQVLLSLAGSAAVKFVRAYPGIPVKDYVNDVE